jgi:TPR repeat protein
MRLALEEWMKRIVIGFVVALLSQAFASPARADGASAPLQPFEQVLERAEKGDVEAEVDIGIRYQTGEGVARDVLKAIGWYRGPAEKGNAKAQFLLGTIYFNGAEGVRQNYAEALRWYRPSAEQKMPAAQFSLGVHYERGLGVAKDEAQAIVYYRLAAEQGYATAPAPGGAWNEARPC